MEKLERGELSASIDPRLTTSLDKVLHHIAISLHLNIKQLLKKGNEKEERIPRVPIKEITLRVLSNWGDKSQVGITEVLVE